MAPSGAALDGRPGKPLEIGSLSLIILCQSMQALAYGGIALFLPVIQRDIGLSFTQAGTLAAASTIVYAVLQIPSGYLADRVGPKRLFLIGLLGTNLLALSFAGLHDYHWLLANQAVSGCFRSLLFAPGLLLISALFPSHRKATAMGLYVAGGFSSSVFLNLLGPSLVGPLGWRALFRLFSAAGLVILVLYWRCGAAGPSPARTAAPTLRDVLRIFRSRLMWVFGVIQYARVALVAGLSFWLPTFLVVDKGYSLQLAGLLVALGAAVTGPANFVGGYISDRLRNPLLVIGTSLGMLALTTALLVHVHTFGLLVGVFVVNGIFVQFYFGPLFAVQIQRMGPERAGLATGCGNFFANLGSVTCAYLLGRLKDLTGSFTIGLYGLSGLCLAALCCTIALSRMAPTEPAPAAPPR
jgi:nitrate/nitrite transporter NarK